MPSTGTAHSRFSTGVLAYLQSNDADHAALALSNNALPTMHCATRER
ncbi:hypothetical protein XOC_3482 [Xanthomonas oryzae pv. oryzicola BLS256]|uniref:Uncharacterized protein n=1 Tax=Xanthomonas oryzae pv. oryzicola (strain BLS256) TaxID=383407 RepID=G7TDP7_XANOB|nr:hypothetical protein XOC_3482 [Xanthomonas oryzae pv. oryzicola BLS256]